MDAGLRLGHLLRKSLRERVSDLGILSRDLDLWKGLRDRIGSRNGMIFGDRDGPLSWCE